MHISYLLAAAAAIAFASPLAPRGPAGTWTMQSFKRTCSQTSCHYSYSINLNNGSPATGCAYDVAGNPASQASYALTCGSFAISSSWSGQFGPGNGFQTLAVKNNGKIIYPAYTDAELSKGTAVSPDKSYTPQTFAQAQNVQTS